MAVRSRSRTSARGRSPTVAIQPKADVHGIICPHLIEYSVTPASPQSAAAAGLNVFSDIRNCIVWGVDGAGMGGGSSRPECKG
jgi:hypothetical protein